MDYNLLSLLAGVGNMSGGRPGSLPKFQGGEGLDQNLLALLLSQGMLPRHQNMSGEYILPSKPQPTYGFHSPSQLDAFKAEGSMASRMGPYFQKPQYGMLPDDMASKQIAYQAERANGEDLMAQEKVEAMQPTPDEIADMVRARMQGRLGPVGAFPKPNLGRALGLPNLPQLKKKGQGVRLY